MITFLQPAENCFFSNSTPLAPLDTALSCTFISIYSHSPAMDDNVLEEPNGNFLFLFDTDTPLSVLCSVLGSVCAKFASLAK